MRENLILRLRISICSRWAQLLALMVASILLWIGIYFSGQYLLEWESFRQTQTALTSYWMIEEGWRLDYQTPVLGYPWPIPFEFPIYQTIVASISWIGDLQLDRIGRLVSIFFLLACAWPALATVRRLNLPIEVAWVFCALLWSSPLYIFYGRMFLMETAALFFALAFIPFALDLTDPRPRWQSAAFFVIFATLALLQKLTTGFPVLVILACVVFITHLRTRGCTMPTVRQLTFVVLAFSVPLSLAAVWTQHANSIRAQNYYGATTTFSAQSQYYFGALNDKVNIHIIKTVFWDRIIEQSAAGLLGIVILSAALYYGQRHARNVVVVCLGLFVLPILLFTRVHYFLPYYQTACVAFLLGALSVACVVCLPWAVRRTNVAVPFIVLMLVASNFAHFAATYGEYLKKKINMINTTTLAVSDVIRRYTPKDSAILVYGLRSYGAARPLISWSSEIAYYSQRKSFTVEKWFEKRMQNNPASFLGGKQLGSIVFCSKLTEDYARIIKQYAIVPQLFKVNDCYIWLPEVKEIELRSGEKILPQNPFAQQR
jgi:hypothetical protein